MIGTWLKEDQQATSQRHMFERDKSMSSTINNYSTLDSEYNWEAMRIQLGNQQPRTFDNHN